GSAFETGLAKLGQGLVALAKEAGIQLRAVAKGVLGNRVDMLAARDEESFREARANHSDEMLGEDVILRIDDLNTDDRGVRGNAADDLLRAQAIEVQIRPMRGLEAPHILSESVDDRDGDFRFAKGAREVREPDRRVERVDERFLRHHVGRPDESDHLAHAGALPSWPSTSAWLLRNARVTTPVSASSSVVRGFPFAIR